MLIALKVAKIAVMSDQPSGSVSVTTRFIVSQAMSSTVSLSLSASLISAASTGQSIAST